jgi:hypothetical protein
MRVHFDELALNRQDSGDSDVGEKGSYLSRDTDRGYALRRFLITAEPVFSQSPPNSPRLSITGEHIPPPSALSLSLEAQKPPLQRKDGLVSSHFNSGHLYEKLDPLASSKATPRSVNHPIRRMSRFSKELWTQGEELDGHIEPMPSVVDNGYTATDFRINDADFTPSGNSHRGKGRSLQFALDPPTMKEDMPIIEEHLPIIEEDLRPKYLDRYDDLYSRGNHNTIPFRQEASNLAQAVEGPEGLEHASDVPPRDKTGESIVDLRQEGSHDPNQVAEASPSIQNKSNIELSSGIMLRTRDLFPKRTLDSVDNLEEPPDEGDERYIRFVFGGKKGGTDEPCKLDLLPTSFSLKAIGIGKKFDTHLERQQNKTMMIQADSTSSQHHSHLKSNLHIPSPRM